MRSLRAYRPPVPRKRSTRRSRSGGSPRSASTPSSNQGVIGKLALGKHKRHVEAKDYAPFDDEVEVHFQKVAPVVVRLVGTGETIGTGKPFTKVHDPIYERTWYIVGAAVVVVGLAAVIGASAGSVKCTRYPSGDPC